MNRRAIRAGVLATLVAAAAADAAAQRIDGHVSVMADALPAVQNEAGDSGAYGELRVRVFAERVFDAAPNVRFTVAAFADGLVADRRQRQVSKAGIVRPQELHVEARWARADLRIGLSRVVWGRLDEFLPTDVINPQDLTRFFLEGRTEGRLPVGMVRARFVPTDRLNLEGIYVPFFRRGRFDQLDEATSPFNVAPRTTCAYVPSSSCLPLNVETDAPINRASHGQGGVRLNATTGRVDWAVVAYRGFESLPLYELFMMTDAQPGTPAATPSFRERFPRFTMVGGDFETVRGEWGVRGEVALFAERTLPSETTGTVARGRAVEAGIAADRRTGSYRISVSGILTRRWATEPSPSPVAVRVNRDDVLIVGAVDRSFARETRTVRAFAVYNPAESSAFARVIASFSVRDNVALELSGGVFDGGGVDALSQLASRDFFYTRLKVFF